jgi:hypothetical protein
MVGNPSVGGKGPRGAKHWEAFKHFYGLWALSDPVPVYLWDKAESFGPEFYDHANIDKCIRPNCALMEIQSSIPRSTV